MKYAIVFSSRTGNTRMLAEAIHTVLPDAVYFGNPSDEALAADRIYLGFWTDKGSCDPDTASFLEKLTDQQVFLFGTAGFGGQPDYFDKITERVTKRMPAGVRVLGSYLCQGKMPMAVREKYEKMQKVHAPVPNLKGMLENFDRALSHPDAEDLAGLTRAVVASLR